LLYVLLALAGGMILTFFAAAGGYVRSLRGMRQERDADRQSLLRRVFDLNARLDGSEEVSEEEAEAGASPAGLLSPTGPIALKLAGRLPLATWVFVTAVNLIVLALFRLVSGGRFDPANPEGGQLLGLVSVGGSVVLILGVFQLGVFAASLRRSLLMGVALLIGYLGAAFGQYYIMPSLLGGAPLDKIWMELIRGAIINGGIACLPVAAGAMAGAYWVFVERERKLAANDRKVLAEEIDRLQGRLHQETQQANYVVFDVVGSTRMKEGADPLAIEYSFTEYHRYVTELVIVNNGVVQSVAGDGVIASFPDADHALRASLAVQERLVDFNRHRNHLPDPFRLRVRIHCGTIIGSASGVTFSHVIDVAAHIEHACPPGKVALSYDTLQALTNVPAFQNHPQNVDGRKLAIVSPSVMELS